jgi:hypothetical protein
MHRIVKHLVPFVLLGIAIVTISFGLVLLAYLILLGALVGIILYCINRIRELFFAPKAVKRQPKKKQGRVIDSDDFKKL